ncbi:hypothetical protein [Streptomyces sp. MP131-18]|uniref:hypothetical protein n=1 Tax=Streptomyces sp. MP131-18 TaxID=1857892 RepID=UPI00097BBCB8|nr:hypothetical protein [Streptomyces sp. MP131-18]ONK09251.1 hypothetical protein STBA_71060 [Streptomyces sp. MP131-18]
MSPQGQPGEAARLTQQLLDAGYSRKQVGEILGRNSSLVSQFFTKGKGASLVPALDAAVRAVQGGIRDVDDLRGIAASHTTRRRTKGGKTARVRVKEQIETPGNSRLARAGRQHIASGASRLRPVIDNTAAVDGKIAFTVRARKRDYVHSAGRMADSPGLKRNVVQRRDGTEERAYGGAPAPGWEAGLDAREWQQRVQAAGGDVTAAVRGWLVETGRIHPDANITNLEIRGWKPN